MTVNTDPVALRRRLETGLAAIPDFFDELSKEVPHPFKGAVKNYAPVVEQKAREQLAAIPDATLLSSLSFLQKTLDVVASGDLTDDEVIDTIVGYIRDIEASPAEQSQAQS